MNANANMYCARLNVLARHVMKGRGQIFRPEWRRMLDTIHRVPQSTLAYISREPAYSCGFNDFLVAVDGSGIVGRFMVGIMDRPYPEGVKMDRVYFACVPLEGAIEIGREFTEEQMIEMLTDSIVRVVDELLAGENGRTIT